MTEMVNVSIILFYVIFLYITLTGTTTPNQSGPGSNSNETVLHILSSRRTRASPLDVLTSYPGHLFERGGSYPSAEMQLAYSTTPIDRILLC